MKYLKKFENLEDTPDVGDYVLMKPSPNVNQRVKNISEFDNFLNTNIGQLIDIEVGNQIYPPKPTNKTHRRITVKYDSIPKSISDFFNYTDGYYKIFGLGQIAEFAKTKEELEQKIQAKKYNL